MFLDEDEMIKLTGRRQPGKQLRYLQEKHVPHSTDDQGRAVVMRDAVLQFMLGNTPGKQKKQTAPNWGNLEG